MADTERMAETTEKQKLSKRTKTRKQRSTDHKVLRIAAREGPGNSDIEENETESEFTERKTRGKRLKRKAPKASTRATESMDTDESAPKKPHFPKLTGAQEMVGWWVGFILN